MANHKSATKRARQNTIRQARNRAWNKQVKTEEGHLMKLLETPSKNSKDIEKALRLFSSKAQRAASRGAISKQRASHRISSLSRKVHKALHPSS